MAASLVIAATTVSLGAAPPCPCTNISLCQPVTRTGPENVYAFHTSGSQNWQSYDWSLITTVCVFGVLDPDLLCHAHANNARVTFGAGGLKPNEWGNDTLVDGYVAKLVDKVQSAYADGFNLDIEDAASDPTEISALTAFTKKATDAMHAANPHSHVTFDTPSEGLLQEGCGQQYGRKYDYKALAETVDFFVVMDYDSNAAGSAVSRLQHYLPASGPPYIYDNETAASAACQNANYSRLCTKAEIDGYSMCAAGWCSDFEGYWMSETSKGCGHAGYNPYTGPAGAFCCDPKTASTPCPTCYFANAALPVVDAGVKCYASLGVPASKLVLAFPWYGYDYTCDNETSVEVCKVTKATQVEYPKVLELLAQTGASASWLDNSSTPYFGYHDASGNLHRVDYDSPRSLVLKYQLAAHVGARGVGMWTASSLNYTNTSQGIEFWNDLKAFRNETLNIASL